MNFLVIYVIAGATLLLSGFSFLWAANRASQKWSWGNFWTVVLALAWVLASFGVMVWAVDKL